MANQSNTTFFGPPGTHNPGPYTKNGRLSLIPGIESTASYRASGERTPTPETGPPPSNARKQCKNQKNSATLTFKDPGGAMCGIICSINKCECVPLPCQNSTDHSRQKWKTGDGSDSDKEFGEFYEFLPRGTEIEDDWVINTDCFCICNTKCEYQEDGEPTIYCTCKAYPGETEADGTYKKRCVSIQSYGKGKANPFDGLYDDMEYKPNLTANEMDRFLAEARQKHIGYTPCEACWSPYGN